MRDEDVLIKKQRFSQNELLIPPHSVSSKYPIGTIYYFRQKNTHTGISILFLGVLK
jgi:hypothetical protein